MPVTSLPSLTTPGVPQPVLTAATMTFWSTAGRPPMVIRPLIEAVRGLTSGAGVCAKTNACELRKSVETIKRGETHETPPWLWLLVLLDQLLHSVGLPFMAVGVVILQLIHDLSVHRLKLGIAFGGGGGARQTFDQFIHLL